MFVNSIDKKPLWTRPDGVIIRDLTDTMFNLKNRNNVTFNVYRVPKDYVMRPDLISNAIYNNSAYAEIILKYNGFSNPFAINEGDLILVPSLEGAQASINKREKGSAGSGADMIRNSLKYIDPKKIPQKDKEVQNFDERPIAGIGVSTESQINRAGLAGGTGGTGGVGGGAELPPNIAQAGATQITYRNGRVYFGDDTCPCLKNGASTSEFLSTVIKGGQ